MNPLYGLFPKVKDVTLTRGQVKRVDLAQAFVQSHWKNTFIENAHPEHALASTMQTHRESSASGKSTPEHHAAIVEPLDFLNNSALGS